MTTLKADDHYWMTVPVARARIREIVKSASGRVLDVGSNEGFISQALKEKGLEVVSLDNDDKAIEKAKKAFGIETIKGDANDLPFESKTFDLVIGGEILEHLINPGVGLAEMFRVSKGWVIVSLPIGEYWNGEASHLWQLDAKTIEHDHGIVQNIEKKNLILEFKRIEGR